MYLVLLILLILLLAGSYPGYPYNRAWGYGPFGVVGLLLLILVILLLAGAVPARWAW